MLNDFQSSVPVGGYDGFYTVKRHNNPLREFGLVHRDLGKIGAVEPGCVISLASRLVSGGLPFKHPLVIGLSESSILLGRVVCEFFGGELYVFSTRYPHQKHGFVPFTEPHSHSPSQYLDLSRVSDYKEICIIEDEVTTGNTMINLVRVLAENLPTVTSIAVLALKILCSDRRYAEMKSLAKTMGIDLSMHSIYRDKQNEDSNLSISVKNIPAESPTIPNNSYPTWEFGRGRIEPFSKEKAAFRYKRWEAFLCSLNLTGVVTVIGVSEAIDLAFEISYVLSQRGYKTYLRHFTISPWEVPGWIFPHSVSGIKTLHLYMPPERGGTYIVVYDQPFQEEQVIKLRHYLQGIGAKTFIVNGNAL